MKTLLHICCAPCSLMCIESLASGNIPDNPAVIFLFALEPEEKTVQIGAERILCNEVKLESNAGEFNMDQDFNATRVLFESDVAF